MEHNILNLTTSKLKAKFQASLKWLFAKAYLDSPPKHLIEPFFEENEVSIIVFALFTHEDDAI